MWEPLFLWSRNQFLAFVTNSTWGDQVHWITHESSPPWYCPGVVWRSLCFVVVTVVGGVVVCGCGSDISGSSTPDASMKPDAKIDATKVVDASPPDAALPDADPDCLPDDAQTWFADTDEDGYGTPDLFAVDCSPPVGFVANDLDCNDGDGNVNPDRTDVCDGIDNDCDEGTVEVCPNQCTPATNPAGDVYLFCDQNTNHATATTVCADQEMALARIDDTAENTWVSDQRGALLGDNNVWLGGDDIAAEGVWLWSDGTQFWQGGSGGAVVGELFSNWDGGEPNNGGGNEDCVIMKNGGSRYQWDDKPCGNSVEFVCERYDSQN